MAVFDTRKAFEAPHAVVIDDLASRGGRIEGA